LQVAVAGRRSYQSLSDQLADAGGVQDDQDGGLTLYVQHERPGKDKEGKGLPAPDGPSYAIMRIYPPSADVIF
jgi:hypothetical protein